MQIVVEHHIQKHILKTLTYCNSARFRDIKPKNTDSTLYNYHLKLLIKAGLVEKINTGGYKLSPGGMRFADLVSIKNYEPRKQPKLLTKLVSINENNEILLWPKHKQPFIGQWSLPSGKMHFDDISIEDAIKREIKYMTQKPPKKLKHKGVMEYRAFIDDVLVSHTVAHIFTAELINVNHSFTKLVSLNQLNDLELSPGTKESIDYTLKATNFYYKKLDIFR
ncbi:MAG: NUDIX domain-containing protein [Patescibacteria group bacterium]|nr:NUDIX domain-containing protein [Patescibacteria group bacterium]